MKDGLSLPNSNSPSTMRLKLEAAGLSDVGCKRTNNEDSFGYDLEWNVFIVCDGWAEWQPVRLQVQWRWKRPSRLTVNLL